MLALGRAVHLLLAMGMARTDIGMELWLVDLARCAPALEAIERETPRLADGDRERAGAIRDSFARRERIAAYIALRVVLERAAGAGVRRRPLARGPGAPRLAGGGARFSLSHTEGFALIGVAATLPIGVDVERARSVKMAPRRRDEICAVGAGLGGDCLSGLEANHALVQAWVRLEAFTKARERPLFETLVDLGLRGKGRWPAPLAHLRAAAQLLAHQAGLTVCDLSLPRPLQAAVAVGAGACPPCTRQLPADRAELERLLIERG